MCRCIETVVLFPVILVHRPISQEMVVYGIGEIALCVGVCGLLAFYYINGSL